jgi:hypothetical protein
MAGDRQYELRSGLKNDHAGDRSAGRYGYSHIICFSRRLEQLG